MARRALGCEARDRVLMFRTTGYISGAVYGFAEAPGWSQSELVHYLVSTHPVFDMGHNLDAMTRKQQREALERFTTVWGSKQA